MSNAFTPQLRFGFDPVWVSLAVLTATYAAIIAGRFNRAVVALIGAAVVVILGVLDESEAKTFADVEWSTIFFFIGPFVVVHAVEVSGVLKTVAKKFLALTGGRIAAAGSLILWVSAILSAIVDNIPFVATMIPLIKNMGGTYGGPAAIEPLWWILSLGACLGGNGTLVGASANLAVAGIAERNGIRFGFMRYLAYAAPLTAVSIAICQIYLWLRYFEKEIPLFINYLPYPPSRSSRGYAILTRFRHRLARDGGKDQTCAALCVPRGWGVRCCREVYSPSQARDVARRARSRHVCRVVGAGAWRRARGLPRFSFRRLPAVRAAGQCLRRAAVVNILARF